MEVEIREVMLALVWSVPSDQAMHQSSSLFQARNDLGMVLTGQKSVTETSPPTWYSVRLLNKNHVIENILEGQIKATNIWRDSKVQIFLVKSAQLQE